MTTANYFRDCIIEDHRDREPALKPSTIRALANELKPGGLARQLVAAMVTRAAAAATDGRNCLRPPCEKDFAEGECVGFIEGALDQR